MTSFDCRKVFGVAGNVPGITNGFREFTGGATHPGEAYRLWGDTPALSGLVGQPQGGLCAKNKESKEKKKKGGGMGKGGGLLPPNQVQLGLGGGGESSPLARPTPLRVLGPQGKAPSLPPIYTEVLGLI